MVGEIKYEVNTSDSTLKKIFECIDAKQCFLLEAGAGSGKTWTLIESLKYLLNKESKDFLSNNKRIVCITYTNVAKDEILERIDNDPLVIGSTIHEFLWDVIKNFQKELKQEVLLLNEQDVSKKIENLENLISDIQIEYSQYGRRFEEGRITHDDVISISTSLFSKYPKLLKIVANKYPYIFVDEYQDTEERTVRLLLEMLLPPFEKKLVIGFFGDSMQKIYNQGIGKIESDIVKPITKPENFRCSLQVIKLLGKIRPNLIQTPAGNNLEGEISFYHCNNYKRNDSYKLVLKELQEKKNWPIEPSRYKVLFLTHRKIAHQLEYSNLVDVFNNRYQSIWQIMLFERDSIFAKLLIDKIEKLCYFYSEKQYGNYIDLLGIEGFKIKKHSDKQYIMDKMISLMEIRREGSIRDVIDFVYENNLIVKNHKIIEFEKRILEPHKDERNQRDKSFYDNLMKVNYKEVINVTSYIDEFTPYSTKHGVKGAEYENVLVVIDDSSWNQYKFDSVFSNDTSNENRYNRTLNLLYVCCSRAKDKLAILSISSLSGTSLNTINNWFGNENVYDVATL